MLPNKAILTLPFKTTDDFWEVPIHIAWSNDLKFWKKFPLLGTYYLKYVSLKLGDTFKH